jgi:hypothetical protein
MNNPEMIRTAGAATPNGPLADIQEARKISLEKINTNACSCTILDERLGDLIAFADLRPLNTPHCVPRLVGGGVTMDWQTKVVDQTIELAGNDADVQLILLAQRLQQVADAHPAIVTALTVLLQELEAVPEAHLSMIDAFTDMAKWAAQRVEQLEQERLRRDGAEVLPLRFESDGEA